MIRKIRAFTLVEILVVIVILGALAALSLVKYGKAARQEHERDAVQQLRAIHSANEVYYSRNNQYLPTGTGNLAEVNSSLGLSIVPGSFTYSYARSGSGTTSTYAASAVYTGSPAFTIKIKDGYISNTNPCCTVSGACPSVPFVGGC